MSIREVAFWDLKNPIGESKLQFEEGIGPYVLAAIAQSVGAHSVVQQDHNFGASPKSIADTIHMWAKRHSDLSCALGFSVLSSGTKLLFAILKEINDLDIPIVIGGAGASIEPERIIREASCLITQRVPLVLIEGDGENAFRALLNTNPDRWHAIEAVWRRAPDGAVLPGQYQQCDIEQSPNPLLAVSHQRKLFVERSTDMDFSDLDRYGYLRSLVNSQFELGKGCYYRCGFCNTSCLDHQEVRKKSPEKAVEAMLDLHRSYGITFFSFTDNIAFDDPNYWSRFADLLISTKESPAIFFGGYSSPRILVHRNLLTHTIPKLYQAGLRSMIIGVQAGSKRILRDIIKRPVTDPEDAVVVVDTCVAMGVNVKIDFIIGHPTETVDDLKETYHLMRALQVRGAELFVRKLNIVPQSRYDDMLQQHAYDLPEETDEWNYWAQLILSLKRDDSVYHVRAFHNGAPNKYLIDRTRGIYYPHEIFSIEMLSDHERRLCESIINPISKDIYERMFQLIINHKKQGA
jgi:radical SAM superfamily enzyme YgiQ (UPF0313 family)